MTCGCIASKASIVAASHSVYDSSFNTTTMASITSNERPHGASHQAVAEFHHRRLRPLMTICTVMEEAPAPLSTIGKRKKHRTCSTVTVANGLTRRHYIYDCSYFHTFFLRNNSQAESSVAQKGSNVLTKNKFMTQRLVGSPAIARRSIQREAGFSGAQKQPQT